ncbi:MAG: cupin domain-containing protein [Bacteroidetes bacterium]|nr:cupin domain-containing protein [Bacteroidota bacterium]
MKNDFDYKMASWTPTNIKGFSSSEILDLNHGGLKYLRVEPNTHYPIHMHVDKVEYAVIVAGSPTITINETPFAAKVGEVYVFPTHTKHAISNNNQEVSVLLIGSIKVEKEAK